MLHVNNHPVRPRRPRSGPRSVFYIYLLINFNDLDEKRLYILRGLRGLHAVLRFKLFYQLIELFLFYPVDPVATL